LPRKDLLGGKSLLCARSMSRGFRDAAYGAGARGVNGRIDCRLGVHSRVGRFAIDLPRHLEADEIKCRRVGSAAYPPWKSHSLGRTEMLRKGRRDFRVSAFLFCPCVLITSQLLHKVSEWLPGRMSV
jgi:hypothetical protein